MLPKGSGLWFALSPWPGSIAQDNNNRSTKARNMMHNEGQVRASHQTNHLSFQTFR